LAALAAEGFDALTLRMKEAAAGVAPGQRLGAIGAAYVRFALDAPNLFRLMFSGLVRARDHAGLAAAGARAYAVLAGATRSGPTASPHAVAAWANVHGLAHLLLEGQIASVRDDRAAAEGLVEQILGTKT